MNVKQTKETTIKTHSDEHEEENLPASDSYHFTL